MKPTVSTRLVAFATAALLLTSSACSDDADSPTGLTVASVVGDYVATRLTATTPLGTQDVLESGGSLTMRFSSLRAVMGHLTIPGEGIDDEFLGTWRIDGGKVHVSQETGDVFFGEMEFDVVGNTLVGDRLVSGVRIQAVLTKQ